MSDIFKKILENTPQHEDVKEYFPLTTKLNGKWPIGTFLQRRIKIVRANPLYQNLYNDVKKEGDCNGRK